MQQQQQPPNFCAGNWSTHTVKMQRAAQVQGPDTDSILRSFAPVLNHWLSHLNRMGVRREVVMVLWVLNRILLYSYALCRSLQSCTVQKVAKMVMQIAK
jgi:hypothetical protein